MRSVDPETFCRWRQASASKKTRHAAFTLLELLVVLGVIGLLVALILPAVQAAREASRKMRCQANLSQIGLAMHHFESVHGRLPGGGWGYKWQGFSDIEARLGQPGGWTYSLLPYLEQASLYDMAVYNAPPRERDHALKTMMQTPVAVYSCPSRRGPEPKLVDTDCASCARPIGTITDAEYMTRGDYAVNVGDGDPDVHDIAFWPGDLPGPVDVEEAQRWTRQDDWPRPPSDWSGVSYLRRSVRLSDVTDGLSATIYVGEKYVDATAYHSGTDWGDNEGLFSGFNNDNHRSVHPHWVYKRDQRRAMSIGSFGSAHSAGHFVMCDGSVRPIAYSVDVSVFRAYGNRHDGRVFQQ